MTDTMRVRPWPGLILDGIPTSGADIPRALAEEWIGNHLVVRVAEAAPAATTDAAPAATTQTAGRHPAQRRSTR